MKNLLIVEDEDMERRYLLKAARTCFASQTQVHTAVNGQAALELFLEIRPEVVISDIYMPIMDGLSLVEKIKEIEPDTICYILTSYDYFSYAQRAIQIGIEDFMLKPISRSDIRSVLAQADSILKSRTSKNDLIERIHALEQKIERDCFVSIVMSADPAQLAENLQLLGLSGQEECCAIQCADEQSARLTRDLLLKDGLTPICGQYEGHSLLFVFAPDSISLLPAVHALTGSQEGSKLLISALACSCQELICVYHSMIRSSRRAVSADTLCRTDLIESDLTSELARRLFDLAEENTPWSAAVFEEARTLASDLPMNVFYPMLINQIEELTVRRYGERASLTNRPSSLTSPELGVGAIFRNLELIIRQKEQTQSAVRFRKASVYIEKNFRQQIFLEDVAEHLHLSVYSLSKLLNTGSGINFSDLLHLCRVEEAKKLIRQGTALKQAAWQAGYHSQSYFSRTFKRLAGVSPKEYREIYEAYLEA